MENYLCLIALRVPCVPFQWALIKLSIGCIQVWNLVLDWYSVWTTLNHFSNIFSFSIWSYQCNQINHFTASDFMLTTHELYFFSAKYFFLYRRSSHVLCLCIHWMWHQINSRVISARLHARKYVYINTHWALYIRYDIHKSCIITNYDIFIYRARPCRTCLSTNDNVSHCRILNQNYK